MNSFRICKNNKFKILDNGNFYFPFMDEGKEFIVENTIDITLNKKDTKLIRLCLNEKETLHFGTLARLIWSALKELDLKEYKNHWFVPIRLYKFEKNYICVIDILKKVELEKKSKK